MSDLKPHRRWPWLAWVPAVVLSLAIAGAVVMALVYVPQFADGPPPPEPGQVDDRNFSLFTEEGLEFIERERAPRIDVTERPVSAATLGLPDDGALTIGPHPTNLDYRLSLLVRGEATEGVRFSTETFTLVTEDGALVRIDIQPASFEPWWGGYRDVQGFVAERGARYGFEGPTQDDLLALVIEAQESGEPGVIVTEEGTATGLPVASEIICSGSAFCTATFIVTLPVG